MLSSKTIRSPIGSLTLVATESALVAVLFENERKGRVKFAAAPRPARSHRVLEVAARELAEYFKGKRETFSFPIEFSGTDFQRKVWRALTRIPRGQVVSYKELAAKVGRPAASRAVGAAVGRNPIGVVVPCHRVVGSNGKLTGFAGGLEAKRRLLQLERPRGSWQSH